MPNTKIIYSMRIALQLQQKGFKPLAIMPNPKHPQFNCWVFEFTKDLRQALDELLGGNNNG